MTEMEFGKACRGPLMPVENEYAWGNDTMPDATWIVEPDATPPVPYPQGICGKTARTKVSTEAFGTRGPALPGQPML